MGTDLKICLLNDSFPPLIDGVSNTVKNYAARIKEDGGRSFVVTPSNPDADDSQFDYPVYRYPSFDTTGRFGYRLGYPFAPQIARELKNEGIDILHSHCPAMSTIMGKELQSTLDCPLIMTYHTKFDEDIAKLISVNIGQDMATRAMISNINMCDEIWAVSRGAGENLVSLGYEGEYVVMQNGVDMPKGRLPEAEYMRLTEPWDLPVGVPVFLFVGRLFWYKGVKIILDALAALKSQNIDFRMVIIGQGRDEQEMLQYTRQLGLSGKVIFTGAVHDRQLLRAWYCRADLFLFPSSYDTNGLVVGEAAACSLPSVLISGSCAAENIVHGRNGFLVEENAASMAVAISRICERPAVMKAAGEHASEEVYFSWARAIELAEERYRIVIDKYRRGEYKKARGIAGNFFNLSGNLMGGIANAADTVAHMEATYNKQNND